MVVWGNQQDFHGHIAPTQMLSRVCDLRRPPAKPRPSVLKFVAVAVVILSIAGLSWHQYRVHRDQQRLETLAAEASNSEHAKAHQLSESDVGLIDNALVSSNHDQRERALRIASSYDDVKLRHKDCIGQRALSMLDQMGSKGSSNNLAASDQVKVLDVLFALGYSDATAKLIELMHDAGVDQSVRLHAAEGLPKVLPSQVPDDTLNSICEHMLEYWSSNTALYERQMMVLYKYNPIRGLKELESLVERGRAEDVEIALRFYRAVYGATRRTRHSITHCTTPVGSSRRTCRLWQA